MNTLTSADGTRIAYDELGAGPPLIMIVGAFNVRSTTAPLAAELQESFTVFNYDRRGRGDSGDGPRYAVEREIEDLDALVHAAGGSARVFGYSSGAILALKAAASGVAIERLALYEPPFLVDESRPRPGADLAERVAELVAADRRGEAVELYQSEGIGLPQEVVVGLREAPFRAGMERVAHTLVYDAKITGDMSLPPELASIQTSTLVINGEDSWDFLRSAARATARALPHGNHCTLADQSHSLDAPALAPVLERFFADGDGSDAHGD